MGGILEGDCKDRMADRLLTGCSMKWLQLLVVRLCYVCQLPLAVDTASLTFSVWLSVLLCGWPDILELII